jgi:two-component system, chemotaxis family, protein-glutamate methylesterase/glutaminase
MSLRVLVVDDTVLFRRVVCDALAGVPGIEVVGTASNGRLALAKVAALRPDVMTLDVDMPELNGIEVLEALRRSGSTVGAIMLSSLTVRGGVLTVRSLELGAFDFLTKPEGADTEQNRETLRARLVPLLRAFEARRKLRMTLRGQAVVRSSNGAVHVDSPQCLSPRVRETTNSRPAPRLILIGVSTGGPLALGTLLPALPADLGVPVFIVQHMPPLFTQALATSLARKCAIRVQEAVSGTIAEPNCAYVAPGGKQMKLATGQPGQIIMLLTDDPPEQGCRPAVDYLFRSVALQFPGRSVAAVLTGMGKDGTAGLRMLKRGGCYAIAQNEESCVVFGMPKEAIAAGVIDTVLPLDKIAGAMVRALRDGRG